MSSDFDHFIASRTDCEAAIDAAVTASEKAIGRSDSWAGIWGSLLHARVILNAGSMIKIIESATDNEPGLQLLDHFSIASIARTAMEAGLMMLYVSDMNADRELFEMRRKVFLLHDTCHRTRMFKHGEKSDPSIKDMRDVYREKIAELKIELNAMPLFADLSDETRKRIVEGRDFYVGGVRGALREVGWDQKEYESFESYLSGYVHSMPMSFLRADLHGLNFNTISDFQYALCGTALQIVAATLERTTARMNALLEIANSKQE